MQGYGMPQQGYGMPQQGYGMPPQQQGYGGYGGGGGGYGGGGGGKPRADPAQMTPEDHDRIAKTIHVAGIRGLRGQPGIQPGEEITEEDLAAFFGNDGEVRRRPPGRRSPRTLVGGEKIKCPHSFPLFGFFRFFSRFIFLQTQRGRLVSLLPEVC
jgi:hypothetical protein